MACQTSHNYKFIADLLDLDNPLNGYLCINIDNPFKNCINVVTIGTTSNDDNDNGNNTNILKLTNHCPAAPFSAYRENIDGDVLIKLFYDNILSCLAKNTFIHNSVSAVFFCT